MAYDALLIHTVEVFRRTGRTDRFGQPVEPEANRSADATYPCRLDEPSGGERFAERSRDVVQYTHLLFLPVGAELFEADRVTVRDSTTQRALLDDGNVTEVKVANDFFGPHHVEAKVKATRSGSPHDASALNG